MARRSHGIDAAIVADIGATVASGVRVQDLPIPACLRYADAVTRSRHRGEIAHGDDDFAVARSAPHECDHALLPVGEIDDGIACDLAPIGRGDDFKQAHGPRRIEKVRAQKPAAEVVAAAFGQRRVAP